MIFNFGCTIWRNMPVVHTKWNPGHFQTTFLHACYFLQRHSAVTDVLFGLLITKKMEANGIFCFYMQCPWVKFWYCNEEKLNDGVGIIPTMTWVFL